jgi:hypothetical protein
LHDDPRHAVFGNEAEGDAIGAVSKSHLAIDSDCLPEGPVAIEYDEEGVPEEEHDRAIVSRCCIDRFIVLQATSREFGPWDWKLVQEHTARRIDSE